MAKCRHEEVQGLECKWENCPMGLGKSDWEDLVRVDEWSNGCSYRSDYHSAKRKLEAEDNG